MFLQGGKNSEIRDSRGVSSKNRQRSKAFHTLMTQKNRTPVLMLKTHDRNENTSLTKWKSVRLTALEITALFFENFRFYCKNTRKLPLCPIKKCQMHTCVYHKTHNIALMFFFASKPWPTSVINDTVTIWRFLCLA